MCSDADGEPVPAGEGRSGRPGEHVRRGLLSPALAHRRPAPSQHVLPVPPDARTPPPRQSAREAGGDILRDRPGAQELRADRRDDMLHCLIDSRYKDGRATTESEVTGLLVALLFAGHHTSCTVTAWTAARLLRNG
jgi:cytochrome P450